MFILVILIAFDCLCRLTQQVLSQRMQRGRSDNQLSNVASTFEVTRGSNIGSELWIGPELLESLVSVIYKRLLTFLTYLLLKENQNLIESFCSPSVHHSVGLSVCQSIYLQRPLFWTCGSIKPKLRPIKYSGMLAALDRSVVLLILSQFSPFFLKLNNIKMYFIIFIITYEQVSIAYCIRQSACDNTKRVACSSNEIFVERNIYGKDTLVLCSFYH